MKHIVLIVSLALLGSVAAPESAQAYQGAGMNLGFQPFGFYQPYGIRYSTSVRTPPYFALNPPVYYGSRYARPYGASPFASPPLLSAPSSYQVRPAAAFVQPMPTPIGPQVCNPYCAHHPHDQGGHQGDAAEELPLGDTVSNDRHRIEISIPVEGKVHANPFVGDEVALK
jgi:hypothetical protein